MSINDVFHTAMPAIAPMSGSPASNIQKTETGHSLKLRQALRSGGQISCNF